jgi:NAD(P)-dependent dehydrogenase (short-subunit alcohol dehydrogenase family)
LCDQRSYDIVPPMRDVEGKVAFVTGGASGIGLGIARAFSSAGMRIAIGDRDDDRLKEAMDYFGNVAGRVHPVRVDVSERDSMENAARKVLGCFGRIDVLVNNAGVQNPADISSMSYQEWDQIIGVNLGGIFNGIQAFLPHIREHGEGGHVITTASMLGFFTPGKGYGAYCASKFAAIALMESLRADLEGSNIGVSVLCPGPVKSNLEKFLKDFEPALDPLGVGECVLRAMRRNDLYILTHPEFNPIIQSRNDTVLASSPGDVHLSEARRSLARSLLERSIYPSERARLSGLSEYSR